MTAPAQREDNDEEIFAAVLEKAVKEATVLAFSEGRRFQQELIAQAFRDHRALTEWFRKHSHMYIITSRGVEITSRGAAEYVRSIKVAKGDDMPKQDRR